MPELWFQEYDDYSEVSFYKLMNETEFNNSFFTDTDYKADFEELYGDKDAKVLCIMLAEN